MRKIESFFLGLNLFKDRFTILFINEKCFSYLNQICFQTWNVCKVAVGCDVNSLILPDNGKAWNNYSNAKKWELECEVNYEVERGLLFWT